jgi:hypothetical protein
MNFEEAKHFLLLNGSGKLDSDGNPLVQQDGFLVTLRPYQGLNEGNFHKIMEALFIVGQHFSESLFVDRELVTSLWIMCHRARRWGVEAGGMLRRNRLIADNDVARLAEWVDIIEHSTLTMLDGKAPKLAINRYAQYICEHGAGSNVASFVPILTSAIDGDECDDPSTVVIALGRLGQFARPALPKLREAATRTYRFAQPIERSTAEVQAHIHEAIIRIEAE